MKIKLLNLFILPITLITCAKVWSESSRTMIVYEIDENAQRDLTVHQNFNKIDLIPKNSNHILHLQAENISPTTDVLKINLNDEQSINGVPIFQYFDLPTPWQTRLQKMTGINMHTQLDTLSQGFSHEKICYNVRRAGYLPTSRNLSFDNCTLRFQNHADLIIRDLSSEVPVFPIDTMFVGFFEDYERPKSTFSPMPLASSCAFSEIVIRSWNYEKHHSIIHGSVKFEDYFSMDIALKGASISLTSNKNFDFVKN